MVFVLRYPMYSPAQDLPTMVADVRETLGLVVVLYKLNMACAVLPYAYLQRNYIARAKC